MVRDTELVLSIYAERLKISAVIDFKTNLKRIMKERGLSAADLSRQAKIPKSTISEWMQGRQPKFDDAILRLAKVLNVSTETLLTGVAPEEDLVKQVFDSEGDGFIEVHNGIFRLKIEKYVGNKK
ncbi:MAG: helix-turn-helix transcriptional regulator [Bdellovibrionaceae bacterium]|nr:helix-turn-helix transcriptional regulator [Pseudobdellovibrionaceae bacterium]